MSCLWWQECRLQSGSQGQWGCGGQRPAWLKCSHLISKVFLWTMLDKVVVIVPLVWTPWSYQVLPLVPWEMDCGLALLSIVVLLVMVIGFINVQWVVDLVYVMGWQISTYSFNIYWVILMKYKKVIVIRKIVDSPLFHPPILVWLQYWVAWEHLAV